MSKSSLSSVVSNLVRASMGTAVSSSITDDDLDQHVAELILKEAKQKAETYSRLGIKAYLPTTPDPNVPRPNKRFLTSIIKSTDDHNKTILRAQALAAQEIKREKDERERRERRARAEEAAAAERMRRDGRRDRDGRDWDSRRERDRRRDRERNEEKAIRWDKHHMDDSDDDDYYRATDKKRRSRRRHRSPSPSIERDRQHKKSRQRSSSPDDHRERRRHRQRRDDGSRKRRHHTSRSASPRRTQSIAQPEPEITTTRKRTHSASPSEDDRRKTLKHSRHSSRRNTPSPSRSSQTSPDEGPVITEETPPSAKGKAKAVDEYPSSPPHTCTASPQPRRSRRAVTPSGSSYTVRSPSSSPPPLPPAQLPSKMDKYFEDSYDPRLDVATLTVPNVPATGLVSDAEFAGWDAMLELIRQRREDKAERKRLERLGISKDQIKKKAVGSGAADRWASGGDSIMDIEYKKRGSIREWDLGKEGF